EVPRPPQPEVVVPPQFRAVSYLRKPHDMLNALRSIPLFFSDCRYPIAYPTPVSPSPWYSTYSFHHLGAVLSVSESSWAIRFPFGLNSLSSCTSAIPVGGTSGLCSSQSFSVVAVLPLVIDHSEVAALPHLFLPSPSSHFPCTLLLI